MHTKAGAGDHQPVLIGDKNYYGKAFEADLAAGRSHAAPADPQG